MPDQFDSFEAAREQNAEYLGFTASDFIQTRNTRWEIPNPSFLDDEQRIRYDRLQFEAESWERHPDTFEDDGVTVKVRGALMEPYRKKNDDGQVELIEHYEIQLAKAIFGDRYEAFKADGGRASDVNNTWWKMNRMLAERRAKDSKSNGGTAGLAAVPDADTGGA